MSCYFENALLILNLTLSYLFLFEVIRVRNRELEFLRQTRAHQAVLMRYITTEHPL
jgi:hypothetical protein